MGNTSTSLKASIKSAGGKSSKKSAGSTGTGEAASAASNKSSARNSARNSRDHGKGDPGPVSGGGDPQTSTLANLFTSQGASSSKSVGPPERAPERSQDSATGLLMTLTQKGKDPTLEAAPKLAAPSALPPKVWNTPMRDSVDVQTNHLNESGQRAYQKLCESMSSHRATSSFEESRQPLGERSIEAQRPSGGALASVPELAPDLDPDLRPLYRRLGVVPLETPVPIPMLMRLWGVWEFDTAMEIVEAFRKKEILRTAILDDGSTWCLISSEHMEAVHLMYAESLPKYHNELIAAYSRDGRRSLDRVEDDGYIVQNIGHHLICADRISDLGKLLMEPPWIEHKLHAYGVAAIVQDFRRFLAKSEESGVKLLLQAFMLSLSSCMEHPTASMLRQQMLSRLMAVAAEGSSSAWLREWYERQSSMVASEEIMEAGTKLTHLMTRSASLEQAGGLQRMTLRGHRAPVRKVVISPNGRDVITMSEDGTAQVWDMNVGDCVMQLARDKALTDVAVAPDGHLCVVASVDGHCCVWDMQSGQVQHVLRGHTHRVNAVAIDRQGIRCVTASDDGSVRVWGIKDGRCEQILKGHGGEAGNQALILDVAISSDGCMAATVSDDLTCRVWDLDEEGCMHVLHGHTGWVVSVEFIGSSTDLITASHDMTARVWDGERGRCNRILKGHLGRLNKAVVDAGGVFAVTCSDDLTSRVWNLDTGECLSILKGHQAWIADAAITREGSRVVTVSGDAACILWNASTGEAIQHFEGHSDAIRSVVLTYHGRFAVTASDDCTVRVWDTKAVDLKKVAKHGGKVKQIRLLPDGRHVVSCGVDSLVMVWDAGSGSMVHALSGHGEAAVNFLGASRSAALGQLAVTGSADRCICLWDTASGQLMSCVPAQQGSRVKDMCFDGACRTAALLLYDATVSIADLRASGGGTLRPLMQKGTRSIGSIGEVLLSQDGKVLITMAKDGAMHCWDPHTSALSCSIPAAPGINVTCSAMSADGTFLAIGDSGQNVRLARISDGLLFGTLTQMATPTSLVFSPDGARLAVATEGNVVSVWDLRAGSRSGPVILGPHKSEVTGLCFSPTGQLLATWGGECTLRVWSCSGRTSGILLALFMADAAVTCCCFVGGDQSGSGEVAGEEACADIIAMGDALGNVHFLDFPQERQVCGFSNPYP